MKKTSKQDKEIKRLLKQITNKRARIVIEHILAHGFITTEELEKTYGYNHPPRAARDVRESGIPLETFRVKHTDGRSIAAYRFGDVTQVRKGRLQGILRVLFTKKRMANARFVRAGLKPVTCKWIIVCRMKLRAMRKKN